MAGNAINWKKISQGPRKGQRVYVNTQTIFGNVQAAIGGRAIPLPANFSQLVQQGDSWALMMVNDYGGTGPTGMAQKRFAYPTPITAPGATKTLTGDEAITAMRQGQATIDGRVAGTRGLAGVYAAMGYNGKPDVISKRDMDRYVKAGERELFRGTKGTRGKPDANSEAFRSGAVHYAGRGVFGNGTYAGKTISVAAPYSGSRGQGTVIRMTIKKGAKIGKYNELNADRIKMHDAVKADPKYKPLFDEADRLQKAMDVHPVGSPAYQKAQLASVAHDAKIVAQTPIAVYRDVGVYAASRGYDGYESGFTGLGTYYIILNRAAVRVQDTSITLR